LRFAVKV